MTTILTAPNRMRNPKTISHRSTVNSDTSVGMVIWYEGSLYSAATVAFSTATFSLTAGGAATAHGHAADGAIVVTNAATNTAGEIKDNIESIAGWRCNLIGLKRGDDLNATSLRPKAITAVSCYGVQNAVEVLLDESTWSTGGGKCWAVGPEGDADLFGASTSRYYTVAGSERDKRLRRFPDITNSKGPGVINAIPKVSRLTRLFATGTEAMGNHTLTVDRCTQSSDGTRLLTLVAATTVDITATDAQLDACICNPGERLVIQLLADTAAASVLTLEAVGQYGEERAGW